MESIDLNRVYTVRGNIINRILTIDDIPLTVIGISDNFCPEERIFNIQFLDNNKIKIIKIITTD